LLGVGWLQHQPSHAFDDVSTPAFDKVLVIVIPSHILESVYFPLPESQIIWHASYEVLDAIAIFEAGETQSGVSFLQHVVIVRLHALLLGRTLDIFVLFTRPKRVVEIVLLVSLQETMSIAFPWFSNVIADWGNGARV